MSFLIPRIQHPFLYAKKYKKRWSTDSDSLFSSNLNRYEIVMITIEDQLYRIYNYLLDKPLDGSMRQF